MTEHEQKEVVQQGIDLIGEYGQLYDYHKKMARYHNQNYQAMAGKRLKVRSPKSDTMAAITRKKIGRWPLDLSYPEIGGLKDLEIQKSINELILKKSYDLVENQKKRSRNFMQIRGAYEVKLNKRGLLSIYFTNYVFSKGTARGLTLADSLTVDLDTGKVYNLKDFFQEGSNYIQRLSIRIKHQIRVGKIQLITDFHTIHSDQQFYLTNQGIVIYFQTYAYTPYYYGIPQFTILYRDMIDLMIADGPLPRLF
ncbi:DUF3298 and DUF4163 domain-containing protein [Geosporobacter ferrireducens]|uniref:DUF3298 and DUF4163 domain-containing protein n=1 Tax=Geosporobacter ferrireducens TaxID=1424294 RepID=UPI00139CEAC7|nr:DUF3298 and DUF4163 domain-containing protein [Geosporobacter ferrireducens]MTI57042.1 DUF3298 and DUF4163 domain-containing protein [Geosporobacter ferrireducens]